jgi:hypothetical protein
MDYSQIDVAGPDAAAFLQGQLSNDIRLLESRPRMLAAWCNPKGRVIALLRVAPRGAGYALALPAELGEPVIRRLGMFRFRSRVEFASAVLDPVVLGLEDAAAETLAAWRIDNLRHGIPEVAAAQSEAFTPHMLNLDRLEALSFDKGCYPGQEIVARTHYRGASRRRLQLYESTTPVEPGNEIYAGDRKIGDVVNAIGRELLAVVPLDAADDALKVAGSDLTRLPLPYELTGPGT